MPIIKMKNKPDLMENEEVLLANPSFFKDNLRSGWKPGHLYLTNLRLFLWQPARNIFQTSLDNIVGISIQQRGFFLRSKDALCLSCLHPGDEELSRIWIIVKDVEEWEKKIFERSILQINQEAIDRIVAELDPESRAVVSYIWQNRFATTEELLSICNTSNHMEVLLKIKEVINPLAEKMIGSPLLVFEKSKIDPETGRKILFSWWLIYEKRMDVREGTLFDLFDEGDYLRIIMELFGVSEKNIKLKVNKNKLIIAADSLEKKYQEEILLPTSIDSSEITKRCKNGILEVRLKKETDKSLSY